MVQVRRHGGGSHGVSSSSVNRPGRTNKETGGKNGHLRTKATVKRLNMYRATAYVRDKKGNVVGGDLVSKDRTGNQEIDGSTGRIRPDRRWFGNTRVVGQKQLEKFKEEMGVAKHDPFSVVLKRRIFIRHC